MQAVLLAGGQGTRLHPLTLDLPKPMAPVMNRPWLERLVAWLAGQGVTRIIFALCHQPHVIMEHFGDGRAFGVAADFVVETEPLGTGGAIRNAARGLDGTLLVINADVVAPLDVAPLLRAHRDAGAQVSISLAWTVDASSYGAVELDNDGRVRRFIEKPSEGWTGGAWINAGIYLWEPSAVEHIPAGRAVSVEREVFPALIAAGVPVYGQALPSYWLDLGTRERYLALHWDIMAGRVGIEVPGMPPPGRGPEEHVWMEAGAEVAPSATLIGPAVLGAGARVGAGAVVGPRAVIGPRVEIGAGSRIVESVVWRDARLGCGVTVEQSVIGFGVVVRDGEQCRGVLVA